MALRFCNNKSPNWQVHVLWSMQLPSFYTSFYIYNLYIFEKFWKWIPLNAICYSNVDFALLTETWYNNKLNIVEWKKPVMYFGFWRKFDDVKMLILCSERFLKKLSLLVHSGSEEKQKESDYDRDYREFSKFLNRYVSFKVTITHFANSTPNHN